MSKLTNQDDTTLLSQLLDDKNDENIVLFDDAGESVEFEQIAIIPHNGDMYALLRPTDADEDSAAVFKIEATDEDSILPVEDEKLATQILEVYNQTNEVVDVE